MEVSVIIPVYNAAPYLRQSVESAIAQPETAEVIIVEDGSTDNSFVVCQQLAGEFPTIQLFQHPDRANHGLPLSRNLAIEKASTPYIAFLDADDYFLPNRFGTARQLLEADPTLDGVYEAIGTHFQNDAARHRWKITRGSRPLTTMTRRIPPERLFEALTLQRKGIGKFSMIGMVVKRKLFKRTGYFDPHLLLAQDTAMTIKMAAVGRLAAGQLDVPVAMRRVHDTNRSSQVRHPHEIYQLRMLVANTLLTWGQEHATIQQRRLLHAYRLRIQKERPLWGKPPTRTTRLVNMLLLALHRPSLLLNHYYWWEFIPKSTQVKQV
ncbi:MAG: glycosyltransferase family 2 protein [Anaerolineales bacterium]|nr:glycosyltransferase family 2 protein [Anaerolineales bacterium]